MSFLAPDIEATSAGMIVLAIAVTFGSSVNTATTQSLAIKTVSDATHSAAAVTPTASLHDEQHVIRHTVAV